MAGDTEVLRVVRGNPSDDDLAALVAVLLTARATASAGAAPAPRRAGWDRGGSGHRAAHSWMRN